MAQIDVSVSSVGQSIVIEFVKLDGICNPNNQQYVLQCSQSYREGKSGR